MLYNFTPIIISLFFLGLSGSFSHCAFMCGPFVLTMVNNNLQNIKITADAKPTKLHIQKLAGIALLPYHLGRITTYSFIGGLSSFLLINLKEISGFKLLGAVMLILAAMIFIGAAFNGIKIKIKPPFKIFTKFLTLKYKKYISKLLETCRNSLYLSFPRKRESSRIEGLDSRFRGNDKTYEIFSSLKGFWYIKNPIKKFLNFLFSNPTNFRGYFLGLLLGFIPCGLLYGAMIAASAIPNYWLAALAMFIFGIATIPALFITSFSGYLFSKKFTGIWQNFGKIILLINAATLLIMAMGLIFNKL